MRLTASEVLGAVVAVAVALGAAAVVVASLCGCSGGVPALRRWYVLVDRSTGDQYLCVGADVPLPPVGGEDE